MRPQSQKFVLSLVRTVGVVLIVAIALVVYKDKSALKEISLDSKGLKIAFFLLQAAERGGPSGVPPADPTTIPIKQIQQSAKNASSLSLAHSRILWVDDNPENNVSERNALEQLGLQFTLALTTTEALAKMSERPDLVISDFKRTEDPSAGYTLLKALRERGEKVAFVIYSSSSSPELQAEAKNRGAYGETNDPRVLFDMVVKALLAPDR